jgi:hypothetical protein
MILCKVTEIFQRRPAVMALNQLSKKRLRQVKKRLRQAKKLLRLAKKQLRQAKKQLTQPIAPLSRPIPRQRKTPPALKVLKYQMPQHQNLKRPQGQAPNQLRRRHNETI